jgi:hypothetical protein
LLEIEALQISQRIKSKQKKEVQDSDTTEEELVEEGKKITQMI